LKLPEPPVPIGPRLVDPMVLLAAQVTSQETILNKKDHKVMIATITFNGLFVIGCLIDLVCGISMAPQFFLNL
jgi:hypothetical protein